MERRVVIVGAARTPMAQLGGTLSTISAGKLGSITVSEALRRAGLDVKNVDEIIMGNILGYGTSEADSYVKSIPGLGKSTGALTTKEACGSCLMLAALSIAIHYADVTVAGGFENASLFYQSSNRSHITGRIGEMWYAGSVLDSYLEYAGILASGMGITPGAIDDFANASCFKALAAMRAGRFASEIVPIMTYNSKETTTTLDTDDILSVGHSQTQDNMSIFSVDEASDGINRHSSLRTATKRKVSHSPGYLSRIVDGAAAVVFMSQEKASKLGIEPLAEVVVWGTPERDPDNEAMAPVLAINNVLNKAGLQADDVELYEIEEICSAGAVAAIKQLDIDPQRVNVRGGSLALGYPVGASAGRMLTTLLYTMKDMNAKTGMLSMGIGGKDAVSMLLKRN